MERSQSRDAAPACQKDPAEVVLAPPGQAQLGGDPKVDPEPSGEIIYLIWPGRAEDGWMDGWMWEYQRFQQNLINIHLQLKN